MTMPTFNTNTAGDFVAGGAIITTLLGYLPAAAAILGAVWYCVQIWESKTVQMWWSGRQLRSKARKIAKLKAQKKVLVAELDALEYVRHAHAIAVESVEVAKAEATVAKTIDETDTKVKEVTDAG